MSDLRDCECILFFTVPPCLHVDARAKRDPRRSRQHGSAQGHSCIGLARTVYSIYTPYMIVYLTRLVLKTPYIRRMYYIYGSGQHFSCTRQASSLLLTPDVGLLWQSTSVKQIIISRSFSASHCQSALGKSPTASQCQSTSTRSLPLPHNVKAHIETSPTASQCQSAFTIISHCLTESKHVYTKSLTASQSQSAFTQNLPLPHRVIARSHKISHCLTVS